MSVSVQNQYGSESVITFRPGAELQPPDLSDKTSTTGLEHSMQLLFYFDCCILL